MPEHHAVRLPALGRRHQLGLVGGDRPAHLPPGADPLEAGGLQPARAAGRRRRRHRCRSAVRRARGRAPTSRAWPSAHSKSTSEHAVGDVVGQVAVDDVHVEHPALGAGRGRCPRPGSRRRGRGARRSRASAAPARRPRRGRRRPRRRPSRGRAARGRAAGGSAGRRRTGRTGRGPRPPSPSGRGASSGRTSSGSLSNRLSSGITTLILPYAGHDTDPPESFGRVGVRVGDGSGVAADGSACQTASSARSASISASSSATRTIASAARSSASSRRRRRRGPPARRPRPGGPRR